MKRMQKTWLKQHRGIGAQNFLFVSLLMHASIRKTINSYTDSFCPPLIATNIFYPGQTSPHMGNRFPHMGHRFPHVGNGSPMWEMVPPTWGIVSPTWDMVSPTWKNIPSFVRRTSSGIKAL